MIALAVVAVFAVDPRVPYEPPFDADLIVDTASEDPSESAGRVLRLVGA